MFYLATFSVPCIFWSSTELPLHIRLIYFKKGQSLPAVIYKICLTNMPICIVGSATINHLSRSLTTKIPHNELICINLIKNRGVYRTSFYWMSWRYHQAWQNLDLRPFDEHAHLGELPAVQQPAVVLPSSFF